MTGEIDKLSMSGAEDMKRYNKKKDGESSQKNRLTFGIVFHRLNYGADDDRLNDCMLKAR